MLSASMCVITDGRDIVLPSLDWTSCLTGVAFTSECTKCRNGTYSSGGTAFCAKCDANKYSNRGAAQCENCRADEYSGISFAPVMLLALGRLCVSLYGFVFWFFFAFPSYISGVHHFWVRFLRMWPFFNPTIKVVTFHLHGWCVLGVFLLPAFTRLGHERQDLLSPCDEMHVCTD